MSEENAQLEGLKEGYAEKYGFSVPENYVFKARKGLDEEIVREISWMKNEPEWMLEWRLRAFRLWQTQEEPNWAKVQYPEIDYQDAYYYSAPKQASDRPKSLAEVDPKSRKWVDRADRLQPRSRSKAPCCTPSHARRARDASRWRRSRSATMR